MDKNKKEQDGAGVRVQKHISLRSLPFGMSLNEFVDNVRLKEEENINLIRKNAYDKRTNKFLTYQNYSESWLKKHGENALKRSMYLSQARINECKRQRGAACL